MEYKAKDYSRLMGTKGFSDTLLQNHFTLYQGYVTYTNKLSQTLLEMAKAGKESSPEYTEIKRRFGFEFNGMRLHELYFANLGGAGGPIAEGALSDLINKEFGSYTEWELDFKSTGKMRGIGWAVLYQDSDGGRLFNQWINEHETGHLAGCHPLLVMDVFEHAFLGDYGLKRAEYIEAFFAAVDWAEVEKRLK